MPPLGSPVFSEHGATSVNKSIQESPFEMDFKEAASPCLHLSVFLATRFANWKSSVTGSVFLKGTLLPLTHMIADFRIMIEVFVRSQVIISEYFSSVFSAKVVARCLMKILHS